MSVYANIRDRISSGDLLAWSGRSLGGWIVRHWTGARISHVGLALWIGPRLFCIEARPGIGVTMRLLSTALPCEWSPLELPEERWARAEEFALRTLGRDYSWLDAILAGLGLPPRQWSKYQCAEFVAECYRHAGWPGLKQPLDAPIPDDIQRHALATGAPVFLLT